MVGERLRPMLVTQLDASYALCLPFRPLRAMKSGLCVPGCTCAAGADWRAEPANLDLPTLTDTHHEKTPVSSVHASPSGTTHPKTGMTCNTRKVETPTLLDKCWGLWRPSIDLRNA